MIHVHDQELSAADRRRKWCHQNKAGPFPLYRKLISVFNSRVCCITFQDTRCSDTWIISDIHKMFSPSPCQGRWWEWCHTSPFEFIISRARQPQRPQATQRESKIEMPTAQNSFFGFVLVSWSRKLILGSVVPPGRTARQPCNHWEHLQSRGPWMGGWADEWFNHSLRETPHRGWACTSNNHPEGFF